MSTDVPRIKICGVTTRDDALFAVEAGAWAVGCILWSGSPRALRPRRGRAHRHGAAPPRPGLRGVRQRPAGRGRRDGRRHRADDGPAARRRGPGLLLGGRAAHRGQGDQGRRGERQGRHPRARGLPHRLPPARRPSRRDARRHGGDLRLGARALAALADPARAQRRAAARERRRGDRRRAAVRRRHGQRDRGRARASRTPRRSRPSSRRSTRRAPRSRHEQRGRAPLRPLRRPVRPRDAHARPGRARAGVGRRARRRRLPRGARRAAARLRRAPLAAVPRPSPQRGRRPAPVPQARGPQPHRRAQDQQRHRPGAPGPADGQAAHHRRDRRRPARGRHRDRLRADGPRVRRLHGRGGHPPPGAQRPAHEPARRDRVAGRRRRAHAEGGVVGGDPRLDDQRRPRRTTSSARPSARRPIRRSCATCSA